MIKEYIDSENVTGVDISPVCIKNAQTLISETNFIVGDAEDTPVPDSSFDSIICLEVLYYTNDLQRVINNFNKN